jgi:hypothetical protein
MRFSPFLHAQPLCTSAVKKLVPPRDAETQRTGSVNHSEIQAPYDSILGVVGIGNN